MKQMHRRGPTAYCNMPTFELDKSPQLESGVACIKQPNAAFPIIDLADLILWNYSIIISHQNTDYFDVHFNSGKNNGGLCTISLVARDWTG